MADAASAGDATTDAPAGSPAADGDPADRGPSLTRRAAEAVALTVLAVALAQFLAFAALQGRGLYRLVGLLVLAELAYLLAAATYLGGPDGPDATRPAPAGISRERSIRLVAAGSLGLAAFAVAVRGLSSLAGVEVATRYPVDAAVAPETALLALLPIAVFVAPPVEELFFRGVLQSHLRGAASGPAATGGAAALFALVHLPAYLGLSPGAVAVGVGTVFVLGVAIGWAYERTGSLRVAVGIHAGYNLLVVGGTYLLVAGDVVSL